MKRALLVEAEALLPVTDSKTALDAFRELADKWDAAGKVPRADMKDLEGRFKKVEQTIRGAEDDRWRRSNPEAHARASATVAQLESSIASLEADLAKAEAAGNEKKAADARAGIEARQSWLDRGQEGPRRVLRLTPARTSERGRTDLPQVALNAREADRPCGGTIVTLWPIAIASARRATPWPDGESRTLRGAALGVGLLGDAVGVEDAVDCADCLEDVTQMRRVGHLEGEAALGDPVAAGGDRGRQDVDVDVGQHPGDVAEQPGPVQGLDLDRDQEHRL